MAAPLMTIYELLVAIYFRMRCNIFAFPYHAHNHKIASVCLLSEASAALNLAAARKFKMRSTRQMWPLGELAAITHVNSHAVFCCKKCDWMRLNHCSSPPNVNSLDIYVQRGNSWPSKSESENVNKSVDRIMAIDYFSLNRSHLLMEWLG